MMTRLWATVPDWMFHENFDTYKIWVSESFTCVDYEEYDDSSEL